MNSEQRVLHDRYRLLRNLGAGGMGTVWLAEDMLLERAVALKELVQHASADGMAERRARAMQEARALARMNHPAIVPIHDVVHAGDDPWIVMRYIRGRSLHEIIKEGPLDERAIAAIGLPILQALSATHRAGVVHRDVKPTNILVADDRSIFLVDFGIARIDGAAPITSPSRCNLVGTAEFLAPERVLGREAGPAADLWSFGVTLFLALERYSPFGRNGDHDATMYAIVHDDAPEPGRQGKLAQVILKLLRKNPALRPDAEDVARILRLILGGPAPPDLGPTRPLPLPPARPAGRRRDGQPDATPARADLDDARHVIRGIGTDAGAAMLAGLPRGDAARILIDVGVKAAGELLQGIAIAQPDIAAEIMQIFPAATAGSTLGYLRPDTAAAVLQALPDSEAILILSSTGDTTAAAAIMHLRANVATRLLKELPREQAARICRRIKPTTVAAMQNSDPELIGKLLERATPAFREQVRRCRGQSLLLRPATPAGSAPVGPDGRRRVRTVLCRGCRPE